ncbi:MAG TPA: thiamine pyrophosphate-dependent enzyme [Pirellulales bacterium]|jgi:benzoylformate decarboxylase
MAIRGIEAFLELLSTSGVRYIFGNPGTTELPLNDVIAGNPQAFEYILGLQEVPLVAMADGFAMAGRTLGVVNLHTCCGLGNAMGMIYNAYREGTPLLITAGQQDQRLSFEEPILWGNMVEVVRPWTKYAVEVRRVEDLVRATRRAIQAALTPPRGPVFMSLPLDVQLAMMEGLDENVDFFGIPDCRVSPPKSSLEMAADTLRHAQNPAILVGSRVQEADAVGALVQLAQTLGAPVISESGTTHGRLSFPCKHPLYAQGLPLWAPEIFERLKLYDVLLVVGMDLLRQYVFHEPARTIPEHIKLIHLDEDPYQLNKNYALEIGLLGETKTSILELDVVLTKQMTMEQQDRARERKRRIAEEHTVQRVAAHQECAAVCDQRPLAPATFMEAIARVLPPDVAVVEEAVTTTNTMLERLGALKNTSGYFGHRGWALGWGLGVTIGAKLAWPDRPVLGILGEGAAMYGIQGLWSAAHHNIPATFVIANNAQYQILKIGAASMNLPHAKAGQFEGMDLIEPEVDMVGIAKALGIDAIRVTEPDELSEALKVSFAGNKPRLIDVPISRTVPGRLNYG